MRIAEHREQWHLFRFLASLGWASLTIGQGCGAQGDLLRYGAAERATDESVWEPDPVFPTLQFTADYYESLQQQVAAAEAGSKPDPDSAVATLPSEVSFSTLFQARMRQTYPSYGGTPLTDPSGFEPILAEVFPELQLTEQMRCLAEHAAHVDRYSAGFFSAPRYIAAMACGQWLTHTITWHRVRLPTDCGVSCGDANASDPLAQALTAEVAASLREKLRGDSYSHLGAAVVERPRHRVLTIVAIGNLPTLASQPRILGPDTRSFEIQVDDTTSAILDLQTFGADGRAVACEDIGTEPQRHWQCPADPDAREFPLSFNALDASGIPIVVLGRLTREPKPVVFENPEWCDTPLDRPATGADLIEWTNRIRTSYGLAPLQTEPVVQTFIEMLVTHGDSHAGNRNAYLTSGLGVDGLMAESMAISPVLYSDEPCREWALYVSVEPQLRYHLLHPQTTHMSAATERRADELTYTSLVVYTRDSDRFEEYLMDEFEAAVARRFPDIPVNPTELPVDSRIQNLLLGMRDLGSQGHFERAEAISVFEPRLLQLPWTGLTAFSTQPAGHPDTWIPRTLPEGASSLHYVLLRRAAHYTNNVEYQILAVARY